MRKRQTSGALVRKNLKKSRFHRGRFSHAVRHGFNDKFCHSHQLRLSISPSFPSEDLSPGGNLRRLPSPKQSCIASTARR